MSGRPGAEAGDFFQVSAVLTAGVAAWNILQNLLLPPWTYTVANAAATGGMVILAPRLGLTQDDLGIGPGTRRRGLRVGGIIGAAMLAGIGAAATHPRTRSWFRDDRAAGADPRQAAFQTLVRIPIGTAVFEEMLFRGLLLGWWNRHGSTRAAIGRSSWLFGMWHVIPTWQTLSRYRGGALRQGGLGPAVWADLGGVVATTIAGAGLCRLRMSTGSVLAPMIAHAAANSGSYLAAWRVTAYEAAPRTEPVNSPNGS